jgi:hypothetical protein
MKKNSMHVFVKWHVYTVLSTSEIMHVFIKWHVYTVLSTSEIMHVFVKWHVYTVLSPSESHFTKTYMISDGDKTV